MSDTLHIIYWEFLEAVAALSCFQYKDPYKPLEIKLDDFIVLILQVHLARVFVLSSLTMRAVPQACAKVERRRRRFMQFYTQRHGGNSPPRAVSTSPPRSRQRELSPGSRQRELSPERELVSPGREASPSRELQRESRPAGEAPSSL